MPPQQPATHSRTGGSWRIDKGFDRICNVCCLTRPMKLGFAVTALLLLAAQPLLSQELDPGAESQTGPPKRSWIGRVFHPFSSSRGPQYKDPRLRGLELQIQLSPQPLKLSETRQMEVKVT